MGARNGDIFHFRHFSLMHKNSAMKVGTDGVLIGGMSEAVGFLISGADADLSRLWRLREIRKLL